MPVTDTSRDAYTAILPHANRLQQLAIAALADHPEGLTSDEILTAAGLPGSRGLQGQISTLKGWGVIIDTGDRRQNPSGRHAQVLRLYAQFEADDTFLAHFLDDDETPYLRVVR